MSDKQRAEIERLAGAAHDKAVKWHAMGLMNTANLIPTERRLQAIAYAVAEAEMREAQAALAAAMPGGR